METRLMSELVVIAIGGGGATEWTHPEVDGYCLEQLGSKPRIGYIGWASNDDPEKFARFREEFEESADSIVEIFARTSKPEMEELISDLDLIYISDGNPEILIDRLKETSADKMLRNAGNNGTVLAGVGAGASCMFEKYVSRSESGELCLREGLAFVQAVFSSHCDSDRDRREFMANLVTRFFISSGYNVDDGTALVVKGQNFQGLSPGFPRQVRIVHRGGGGTKVTNIS